FYTDFTKFIDVSLAPTPFLSIAPLAGASVSLEAKAIEMTQAVQNRDNTLPLVRNKATVARVYARTANVALAQTVRSYLYASNDGTDLPGSPLVIQQSAPTSIDRNNLNHTANFLLPNSWTQGSYTFSARAADRLGNVASSTPINVGFNTRTVPTVWAVPINTGTQQNPNVTTNANIQNQKDYMRAVYPVHNINFVDKPWQDIGPTTVGNTIDRLNTYYNNAAIAWLFTVLFTGKQPFTLPNQVYGFTPSGGGISDPTWFNNGAGKVARGFLGTSSEGTLAHEINHNLDRSNNGTWGRHVPNGCGADGTDPNWPYANRNINEVGFDTRLPWAASGSKLTVIPNTDPDLMSYCQSGHLPTKWISPYRWQNLYNTFFAGYVGAKRSISARADCRSSRRLLHHRAHQQRWHGAVEPGAVSEGPALGECATRRVCAVVAECFGANHRALAIQGRVRQRPGRTHRVGVLQLSGPGGLNHSVSAQRRPSRIHRVAQGGHGAGLAQSLGCADGDRNCAHLWRSGERDANCAVDSERPRQ
ncbi:MAG: hypothetical protein HC853_08670, partial [Anaerolineae bacterium]|nr:hypothetical protein [Anaerolineae bacterium]